MNIYDFDETIYDSDSTKDFYFYCLKKYPKILLSVPCMAWAFLLYILGVYTKTQFKEKMYRFLRYVPDVDKALEDFWNINENKVKQWYRDRQKEDDIIISASPEFLLEPICKRLGIKHLIASRVDKKTGLYTGENCWGEEKVKRLYEDFPDAVCEEFYSDSLSDTPLAELAKAAKIIRGMELVEWNEYKPSKLKMFFAVEFLSFILVGGINTLSNIAFSTIYSIFITNTTLAFFPGYITSNIVAYLLNSYITFKEKLSFVKFIKFFISYIPNFIIQTIIVYLFDHLVHGPSVVAYGIAAIIGIPITFLFLKKFTFKDKKRETEIMKKEGLTILKVLSFLIPIVGLVLCIEKCNSEPKLAKTYGKCALYGVITGIIVGAIYYFVVLNNLFGYI